MEYEALVCKLVDILRRARIPYMFVGGIAANYWGFPRATFDVDIVIALRESSTGRLVQPLRKLGFDLDIDTIATVLRVGNCLMTRSPSIEYRIDFWIPRTFYEQETFRRRRRGPVYGRPSWLEAPEDLILMKLLAGRGKDFGDALGVIERQGERLDWAYLNSWARRLELTKRLARVKAKRV